MQAILSILNSELLVILGALAVLSLSALPNMRSGGIVYFLGLLVCLSAAVLSVTTSAPNNADTFVHATAFTHATKLAIYLAAAAVLALRYNQPSEFDLYDTGYTALILISSASAGLLVSSADIIYFMLVTELLVLSFTVFFIGSVFRKLDSVGLSDVVIANTFSTALSLFGASLIVGAVGQTDYFEINRVVAAGAQGWSLTFGLLFFLAGIISKSVIGPGLFWRPSGELRGWALDLLVFDLLVKFSLLIALAGLLLVAFEAVADIWQVIVAIASVAAVVIGCIGCIRQTELTRLFASMSLAHTGLAFLLLSLGSASALRALFLFLIAYGVGLLGLMAALTTIKCGPRSPRSVSDLSGLVQSYPSRTAAMTVLLLSLGGAPPFAGFFGRVVVVEAGLGGNSAISVLVLALVSSVLLVPAIRVIAALWFRTPTDLHNSNGRVRMVVLYVCALFVCLAVPLFGVINETVAAAAQEVVR